MVVEWGRLSVCKVCMTIASTQSCVSSVIGSWDVSINGFPIVMMSHILVTYFLNVSWVEYSGWLDPANDIAPQT